MLNTRLAKTESKDLRLAHRGVADERQSNSRSDHRDPCLYVSSVQGLGKYSNAGCAFGLCSQCHSARLHSPSNHANSWYQSWSSSYQREGTEFTLYTKRCVCHTAVPLPDYHWLQHEWKEYIHSFHRAAVGHGSDWVLRTRGVCLVPNHQTALCQNLHRRQHRSQCIDLCFRDERNIFYTT